MNLVTRATSFGELKEDYNKARRGYPADVINYIFQGLKNPKVLDLGCGTGISTRQLTERINNVEACDIDPRMIDKAKSISTNINYQVAPANKLPYPNGSFGIVTAFGAFHWFCDEKSVDEIKRVLNKESIFAVINKNDTGDFKENYNKIVENLTKNKLKDGKENYNPIEILKRAGFKNVENKYFEIIESYDIEEALTLSKSMSIYFTLPANLKEKALILLKEKFKNKARNGLIERHLKINVIKGTK